MRICILSSRLYPQVVGSGTSAHMMAASLARRGHEVAVITDATLRNEHIKEHLPYTVRYINDLERYATGDMSFRGPTAELHDILQQIRPDVLHVCNFMPMMLVTMIRHLLPFPVVFTFYNTPVKDRRSIGYFDEAELDVGLASFIVKSNAYERLIAGGQYYYDSALSLGADERKTNLSYLGVDMRALLDDAQTYTDIDVSEYVGDQIDPRDEYLLLPSRITQQKGVLEAVKSLAHVQQHHPIKLLLTGMARPFSKEYAEQVWKLADELGVRGKIVVPHKVIPRHHLPFFIKRARAVIVPSHYEGLGLAAIEALMLETPLIASDTVGLNEVVIDQVSGRTVKPGDHHALSAAILQTLDDIETAKGFSRNARRHVEKFNIEHHIDFVEQTYRDVVAGVGR